jgi:hypothetical protein
MSIEDHLKTAQVYLSEASKLYEEDYRADVCEKVWAAVKHATIALTTRFLGVTPSPHPKRPSFMLGLPERFVGSPLGRALLIPPIGFPMLGASHSSAGGGPPA